jgi:dinuclear metal center YbgI/SA1388 family protein
MITVTDLHQAIQSFAPDGAAMSFDNVGILVGDPSASVTKAMVSLDVTPEVVEEAAAFGAQVIISHHPVIFQPLKRLSVDGVPYKLAQAGIAVISAHTNYDFAPGGVNECLAEALGLTDIEPFQWDAAIDRPTGLIGNYHGADDSPKGFAAFVKERLSCGGVKYTEGSRPVRRVAVGCGAASSMVFDAMAAGADGFVTGESKHHELLAAKEGGITMVDAGHFNTEDISMEPLVRRLGAQFPSVVFRKSSLKEPTCYL